MTRDVVVIGGGLSGLAACYELEKRGAAYTVIEVKRRFGGGIRSVLEAGFIMDASAFAFRPLLDHTLLNDLSLRQRVVPIDDEACVFRDGSASLIRALEARLQGGRLMRMAVSSIGRLGERFTICFENGIMLDAGALILALPARYAARALWNLAPEAAKQLAGFQYESIPRVSLGYHKRDLPATIEDALGDRFPFIISTDQCGRVPDRDHQLIQVGLRGYAGMTADDAIRAVTGHFGWRGTPIVWRVGYWTEADLLSDYGDSHRHCIRAIRDLLPPGLSLIGSDYCFEAPTIRGIARLDERIGAGRSAARAALDYLRAASR
ncbi:MAG: FAD-dependent oxidoreductase [Chloroflexota bacterium]|nr:FAD-dependent oxidoreductase [Chloroflexota bacterium]MDE2909856.1 FAD-dependent oxidoreductase [Chloroflexota bacterium]